ncbi:HIT family protein [Paenibacillus spongiae]|uniref:HIT family protein n=1 Tax=Paenibacillus spongiae TaxID=2909671 RepID=A0ABY5S6T8_9BACL|nr:HIT family protein [Paenibacillus spongiae]UVI29636.1 HIT family protein [Paenibacillus spongiae]
MYCLGCNLANQRAPVHVVFEDDYVCCFLDHNPYNEGHVLILPKNHMRYFDELDENTANSLIKAAMILSKAVKRAFDPDGITVCQNGGIFDDLTHFHMHIVPRYEGQNFADFYTEDGEDRIEDEAKLAETKRKIIEAIRDH